MPRKVVELYIYDRALGIDLIAGVDEAGRGPLAGPVVAAACIMPLQDIIEGINDSKQLTEKKRGELYEQIIQKAISYSCVSVDHNVIDEINILEATKRAMKECVETLKVKPSLVLIDAVRIDLVMRTQSGDYVPKTKSIIHGDATSYNIAAASIIAKVTRDRMMREYHNIYPEYGFCDNKGYGSMTHIETVKRIGPCAIHRRSFIKNFVGAECRVKSAELSNTEEQPG